jgi:hypothetical protein
MAGFTRKIRSRLSERVASIWVLLADTTNFLSRTSIFAQYEGQLRDIRFRLTSAKGNSERIREARAELVEMRASLRLQGYDLSLGALELSIQGFRNDAAVSEGFKRIVLFIGKKDLWYIAGEDNHSALHDLLEAAIEKRRISGILHKHYLWYRWTNGLLALSGADSESAEDFERLKSWLEEPEHKLALLGKMKRQG